MKIYESAIYENTDRMFHAVHYDLQNTQQLSDREYQNLLSLIRSRLSYSTSEADINSATVTIASLISKDVRLDRFRYAGEYDLFQHGSDSRQFIESYIDRVYSQAVQVAKQRSFVPSLENSEISPVVEYIPEETKEVFKTPEKVLAGIGFVSLAIVSHGFLSWITLPSVLTVVAVYTLGFRMWTQIKIVYPKLKKIVKQALENRTG